MKTLAELRALLAQLISRQESLLADEAGFTDEVEAEVRKIGDEITSTEKSIDELVKKEERRLAALAAVQERTAAVSDIVSRSKSGISFETKKKPFDHILRDALGEQGTFGKYLGLIANRALGNDSVALQRIQREMRTATGMSIQSNEDGGYLIGVTDGGLIADQIYEEAVFAKRATRAELDPGTRSISYKRYKGRSRKDGYRHGGFRVFWEGEGETIDATRLKFETQQINLQSLKAILPVTNDLLINARALESEIMAMAPKSFAFEIDRAMYEGNGVGKPTGIMNSKLKITIPKESGQAADTLLIENIIKAEARTASENSVWYANKNALPQLATLRFTDNSPAFLVHSSISEKGFGKTLFGRPLEFVEFCETIGDEGDVLLADWGAYRVLDPAAIRMEGSMHVYFLTDEYAFRFVKDVNGAPMYDTALEPLKGTETLSEFVTIAAR